MLKKPTILKIEVINDKGYLTLKKFNSILNKSKDITNVILYSKSIDVFNNKDIFDIINKSCTKFPTEVISKFNSISTIDIDKLPTNNLSITIPIESINPELYFKYNNIELKTLLNNLDYLVKYKNNTVLSLQPIFLKDTIQTIDKIIPIARKYNASIKPVYPLALTIEDKANLPFTLENMYKLIEHFYLISNHFGLMTYFRNAYPTPKTCDEFNSCYNITLNGDVYPCSYIAQSEDKTWDEYYYDDIVVKVPQSDYLLGNIYINSFDGLTENKKYRKLKAILQSYKSFEKAHPYSKAQFCIVRKNNNINNKFWYCSHCLHKWDQAC